METLDTYFLQVKNSSRGSKYLVKNSDNLDYNSKTTIICKDCLTETLTYPRVIFWGTIPCKCGHGYYRTPERRLEGLLEKVQGAAFAVDVDNIPTLKTALTKVPVTCNECGFKWNPVLNSIVCDNTGCQRCSKVERYSEEHYVDKINSISGLKFVSKVGDKLGRQEKVVVQCLDCQNIFSPLVGNLFQGKGCSVCANYGYNPSKEGYLYILSIRRNSEVVGYKFGITNNTEERLKKIRRKCIYDIEPVFIFSFPDGRQASDIESLIKKSYGHCFSKEEMSDGFTETVSKDQIKSLINYIHTVTTQAEVI